MRSFARKMRGLRMTRASGLRRHARPKLLNEEEGAEGEGVDAGAVEAADGAARVGDEGLAKEIEGSVDENGGRSGFAEFVEEPPEERVGQFFDSVNAHFPAVKSKAFETCDGFDERGE